MDMNIFLASHRKKLEADMSRLSLKPPIDKNCNAESEKSAKNCSKSLAKHKQCNKNPIMDFQPKDVDPTGVACVLQSNATAEKTCIESSMATSSSPVHAQQNVQSARVESEILHIFDNLHNKNCNESSTIKTEKELANLDQRQSSADKNSKKLKSKKNKDDMEQWISDTFYSYFPGYNNENKKRQDILLGRQLEYQQNFLQHQMTEAAAKAGKYKNADAFADSEKTPDLIQKPLTSRSDKTDLEIIVNNPDYEGRSPRPGSARYRLLQDLKHTEISNIVNSDGVTERNKRNAEMEMAKKKNYQNELMVQIEEKRRSIEAMRERELRKDEALTRKLNEDLRTIRLEEELEKEKMRADKIRFDSEQNRLMREHLLTKLENDTKLFCSTRKIRSENDKVAPPDNKVYKYFSNSARHEYKRDTGSEPPAFHLDLPQSSNHRNECFHQDENICPFCHSPLKSYEDWCLKCEKRIFETVEPSNFRHPVCENCKTHFSVCAGCEKNNESICTNCRRKRNKCIRCRRTIHSHDIEITSPGKAKHKTDSERSFQILEVNYPEESDDDLSQINSNNNNEPSHVPYSINIDRNSIFHHSFKHSNLFDHEHDAETIRQKADKRLSRYLKNYSDMRNRSTQTTPDSASRRDVVIMEENNLSMPLLREMPKMTRKESNLQQVEGKKRASRIENLARRWEVPAVQKHTITTNSPKVLTQLGAIRKQLQSEQFQ